MIAKFELAQASDSKRHNCIPLQFKPCSSIGMSVSHCRSPFAHRERAAKNHKPLSVAVCFHCLTNCFSRNRFPFTPIQNSKRRLGTDSQPLCVFFVPPVAKTNPVVSYSCALLCMFEKVKSFTIKQIRALLQNIGGVGGASILKPLAACWRQVRGYQCG